MNFSNIIGRFIDKVILDKSGDLVTFHFTDGFVRQFSVSGDCCSSSWIEHLEQPNDVNGAELLSVTDSAPISQDHATNDPIHETIVVYNTVFRTTKGDITLEYRNASNGYYGGYLVDIA